MTASDIALLTAGSIGAGTAIVHGVLLHRLAIVPLDEVLASTPTLSKTIKLLLGPLLQFTTFAWLGSGLALIAASIWLGTEAKLALAVVAVSHFLYGAIGNMRATRGRHPGGWLMAIAVALIAFAVSTA